MSFITLKCKITLTDFVITMKNRATFTIFFYLFSANWPRFNYRSKG